MTGYRWEMGLLGLLLSACDLDTCPPIGAVPVVVTVTDSANGAEICDAVVTIASRTDTETRTACPYFGGVGRSPYIVTVEREGYATLTRKGIDAPETDPEGCPESAKVAVQLVRE